MHPAIAYKKYRVLRFLVFEKLIFKFTMYLYPKCKSLLYLLILIFSMYISTKVSMKLFNMYLVILYKKFMSLHFLVLEKLIFIVTI